MAQAPDIEEGDVATVETAKPLASVERDRLQASRDSTGRMHGAFQSFGFCQGRDLYRLGDASTS